MNILGVIPARYKSTRFPGKALVDIHGKPMIVHTYEKANMVDEFDQVLVATDDERIEKVCKDLDIPTIMTSSEHPTGTDRVAEVAERVAADLYVNIQGDEPLVNPDHIDAIVEPLLHDTSLQIAVGVTPYKKKNRTSDIKAVLDLDGNIMYCSRTDLPSDARTPVEELLKMVFIVPFRKSFLLQYTSWDPTPLEQIEYNEYLRVLEHGVKISAVKVDEARISVDTPEDLEEVRNLMLEDKLRFKYVEDSNE